MISRFNRKKALNFEDDENSLSSIKTIRAEFFKKGLKIFVCIIAVVVIYISYLRIDSVIKSSPDWLLRIRFHKSYLPPIVSFDLTLKWSFFSITTFLIVFLLRILYLKITPSLKKFLKQEFKYMGFEIKRRYDSGVIFLALNIISIALLVNLDFNLIQFDESIKSIFIKYTIVIYLFFSLILPIIYGILNDKFSIKLKQKYVILFDFQYNFIKRKPYDPNLLGIYLTSSRLCSRFNKSGRSVFTKISQVRWLPRKRKLISSASISPFLHFHEYSAPINVQNQFLNIALALKEWDSYYESKYHSTNNENSIAYSNWLRKYKIENQFKFIKLFTF